MALFHNSLMFTEPAARGCLATPRIDQAPSSHPLTTLQPPTPQTPTAPSLVNVATQPHTRERQSTGVNVSHHRYPTFKIHISLQVFCLIENSLDKKNCAYPF